MDQRYGRATRRRRSRHHSLLAGLVRVVALDYTTQSLADETSYHIDLTRYFITQSTEQSERGHVIQAVDALAAQDPARHGPKALEAYLHNAETLRNELLRHEAYLHLAS